MSIRAFILLLVTALAAPPAYSALTQQCQWGATPPAVHGNSVNVIHTPVVLNLIGPNHAFAHVAFVSYETTTNLADDGGGVLRVMDRNCVEVARFPDPACPTGILGTTPDLAPVSGLAAGDLDRDGRPEIVAVIGGGSKQHRRIAAFNLAGNCLALKWVSPNTLPANDSIEPAAPAIAQLDRPGTTMNPPWDHAEIIIDKRSTSPTDRCAARDSPRVRSRAAMSPARAHAPPSSPHFPTMCCRGSSPDAESTARHWGRSGRSGRR